MLPLDADADPPAPAAQPTNRWDELVAKREAEQSPPLTCSTCGIQLGSADLAAGTGLCGACETKQGGES